MRPLLGLLLLALSTTASLAECGTASWYGTESGTRTANHERFTGEDLTAAHRSLPFDTWVRVTRRDTGASVDLRINDRGPAAWTGRFLDVSHHAAVILGMIGAGTAQVCAEVIGRPRG